jgi:hypothetical protein
VAAVAERYVTFITERRELEVLTIKGAPIWKEWLRNP